MHKPVSAAGLAAVVAAALWSTPAAANWTLNVGYHNPVVSTVGLNFLYLGSQWGFEAGIGWIDLATSSRKDDDGDGQPDDDDDDTASIHLAGDVDVRYHFSSGKVRPYLQGGFGVGFGAAVGSGGGAGAGTGGGFGGFGLLFGSPSLYAYVSYNIGSWERGFLQAGIGFDI